MKDLIYENFKNFEVESKAPFGGGVHHVFHFQNGYGASVIKSAYTFGGAQDLFELAVLKDTEKGWDLCYDTEITNNVIGYLENDEVLDLLKEIQNL